MLRKIALGIALASLCLAPALAFGIDFKAKGQWVVNLEYGQNGQFTGGGDTTGFTNQSGGQDDFSASQRVRLQLDAVASQSLSGTVYFEIGSQKWGNASQGAALGADGTVVELKNAYIDFTPFPSVKTRMGIQNVTLPGYSVTSQIMSTDVAGIVATINVTDTMDITAMWLRPWNDNFTGYPTNRNANYRDNTDFFGLTIPVNLDGVKLTAWGMYGLMGPNTFREGDNWTARVTNYYSANLFPLLYGNMKKGRLDDWGSVWWAGFTGEVTAFAPWRFAWDFSYGGATRDKDAWNRGGWLASAYLEYALDWGVPGIHGWYGSGDDDDVSNGSERMPYTGLDEGGSNTFDNFAFGGGQPNTFRDARIGHSMVGTWGVGGYVKDLSFIENVTHVLRVNYIGGTNDPGLLKKLHRITGEWMPPNNPDSTVIGMEGLYLTTYDGALSVNLNTKWQVYENFRISVDAGYIHPWLDQSASVWGRSRMNGVSDDVRDAWSINSAFVYQF